MDDRFDDFFVTPRCSALTIGLDHFRGFVVVLTVLISIALVAWHHLRGNIGETLRGRIEDQLNSHMFDHGFHVRIESCELISGQGIRVRGVEFGLADAPESMATIDECFIHIPVHLSQLLVGDQPIQGVELHRAAIQLHRDAREQWTAANLFKIFNRSTKPFDVPPIFIRDSKIIVQVDGQDGSPLVEFYGINLDINQTWTTPNPTRTERTSTLEVKGFLKSEFVKQVDLSARIDVAAERWALAWNAQQATITARLFDLLPIAWTEQLGPAKSFKGLVSLSGQASGGFHLDEWPDFHCHGLISDSSLDDVSLPYPISKVTCRFEIDNQHLKVSQISGRAGTGHFTLDCVREGLFDGAPWRVQGEVKQLMIDSTVFAWLPQNLQKFWQQFSPDGLIDMKFDLDFDGEHLQSDLLTTVRRGSFSYFQFPFRLSDCAGQIRWTNQFCKVELSAEENGVPISIHADIFQPGPESTGTFELKVHGYLPINRKVLASLANFPDILQAIKAFSPTGEFQLFANMEKQHPDQESFTQNIDIQLRNCTVRHKHFDYRLFDVSGTVVARNGRTDFVQIQGARDNGYVVCNGNWTEQEGLNLEFLCHSIALNDQLRNALPPGQQEIWDRIQPSGTVDLLNVNLAYQEAWLAPKTHITGRILEQQTETKSDVSIEPTWFPFRISEITGEFEIGDGKLSINKFSGIHHDTWVNLTGHGDYDELSWKLELSDILVGSLDVNEYLFRAMPMELENAIRALEFKGQVELEGRLTLEGGFRETRAAPGVRRSSDEGADFALGWDLRLTTVGADLFVGVPLKHVSGQLRLIGQQVKNRASSIGVISIDSLMYEGIQITQLVGPMSIDPESFAVGAWANLPAEYGTAAPLTGQVVGGQLALDAAMSCSETGEFQTRLTVQEFDLKGLATELSTRAQNISGKGYAGVFLTGDSSGGSEVRGDGYVRLRDAKIYELPIILSLLNVAKITQADRTAFDEGNVDFTVFGSNFELNRIELIGDMISLIGTGEMNTDQQIKLDFYTMMGRNRLYIPLLTQIYKASSQQILWINVDGTLLHPHATQEILPGLTDSLKQVFQDFEMTRSGNVPTRSTRQVTPLPLHR